MFFGEYQHALDAKGRVILPARFRDRLGDGLVFVPGQDRCVDIYPLDEFERRVESMRTLPREDERGRAYRRVFNAGAHQDSLDGQGRVTVPPRLREYGALDRDLAVVGQDDHIEIWDRSAWETYRTRAEREFAEVGTPFMFPRPS